MRTGDHLSRQNVVNSSHRSRAVSDGAHKTHLHQVLLAEGASGHGRGDSGAPRDEGHVREHVDEAAPRSTFQIRKTWGHWVAGKRFSLE